MIIRVPGFSYIQYDNLFTQDQVEGILNEAMFLCSESKLKGPSQTEEAEGLKSNSGIFLEGCYSDKSISNYLSAKQGFVAGFDDKKCKEIYEDPYLGAWLTTFGHSTLMSYYQNGDYYGAHRDKSSYTFIYWIYKDPKKFEGGELCFPDFNVTIEPKSNSAILMPSWALHEVKEISMSGDKYDGNGRFSFSTFYRHV